MSEGLELERNSAFTLARLDGELTLANAADVSRRLAPELLPGRVLVLDLAELAFLDSAGIHCIFQLARSLSRLGGQLRLVVPPGAPSRRILQIVDPGGYIPMHGTPEQAARALAPDGHLAGDDP